MKKSIRSVFLLLLAAATVVAAESGTEYVHPQIQGHGKVVRLPQAAEQPRAGAKICVDLTVGGPDAAVNPGLEKTARFVNIYAGAGEKPAECMLTVVLHGEATSVALSDAGYAKHVGRANNPNLPLIKQLRAAGVEFFVCGQAMAGKGFAEAEIDGQVMVAVSALTVNVNRQMDGYAYVPQH